MRTLFSPGFAEAVHINAYTCMCPFTPCPRSFFISYHYGQPHCISLCGLLNNDVVSQKHKKKADTATLIKVT